MRKQFNNTSRRGYPEKSTYTKYSFQEKVKENQLADTVKLLIESTIEAVEDEACDELIEYICDNNGKLSKLEIRKQAFAEIKETYDQFVNALMPDTEGVTWSSIVLYIKTHNLPIFKKLLNTIQILCDEYEYEDDEDDEDID